VLKIDAARLPTIGWGDSSRLRVAEWVLAIGNPFGVFSQTVTLGIVSATGRSVEGLGNYEEFIQTDAAINRGNSGGPLLNADGKVIGVNAQIESESGGNVGIGFAIPINTVKEVVSQIIEDGKVEHAYLGVQLQTVDEELASTFRLPVDEGALISHVVPGGPADKAGIKGGTNSVVLEGETYVLGGDLVTGADGEPIQSAEELRSVVNSKQPGDSLALDVNRDGETETITVELGRRPTTPQG
jgi:S1-C subfamily serine protease